METPLRNYIRTYRKRAYLSQEQVAQLLGLSSPSTIAQHESGVRTPSLQDALSYTVALGTPIADLYAGVLSEVEAEVTRRAREMFADLPEPETARQGATREWLASLAKNRGHIVIPICQEPE